MKRHITFDQVKQLIESTAPEINKWKPEVILAIGGGGYVPSRYLRNFIDCHLVGVSIQLYKEDETQHEDGPKVIQWLDHNSLEFMKGKKILIVDEMDDTRRTLSYVVNRLRNEGFSELGVFVLHDKKKEKPALDVEKYWSGEKIDARIWVVYPWE